MPIENRPSFDECHPFRIPAVTHRLGLLTDDRGGVGVVAAVALVALVGVVAFTLNTAYLYLEKNRFQNAMEAAALAGASRLCANPRDIALAVLKANLFGDQWPPEVTPEDWVQIGYYDRHSGKFFPIEELGDGEYPNAVKVAVTFQEQYLVPLSPGPMTVTAGVIAFKEPYGLLAHGKPAKSPDIKTQDSFSPGYPIFKDMGRIHANRDLNCVGSPQITGDTTASAVGAVVNLSSARAGADPVRDIQPINWGDLRAKAAAKGRIFHMSDFPPRNPQIPVDQNYLEYDGNRCYAWKSDNKGFALGLRSGDHGGAVYYLSAEGAAFPPEEYYVSVTGIAEEHDSQITNFTVASELPLTFDNPTVRHILGGPGHQMAYIYSKHNIGALEDPPTATMVNFLHDGVVYRTEKNFLARLPFYPPSSPQTYRLRIIAEGSIKLYGGKYGMQAHPTTLDGGFGPPCGPGILHLVPVSSQ